MSKRKGQRKEQVGEYAHATPIKRTDGELYARPAGDSPEFLDGYEDGYESRPEKTSVGTIKQIKDYVEGYALGKQDREDVDRDHSSNT